MRGIIYLSPALYNIAVRLIYGRGYIGHHKLVTDNIEKGWSVLDLCCGSCYIKNFLERTIKYEGRDFNEHFLKSARQRGIDVSFCDLKKDFREERRFDCVIMVGSLHQFIPDEDKIINKMKRLASKRVIISESPKNIVQSKNRIISSIAKLISNPGGEGVSSIKRFTHEDILALFKRHGADRIIDGGKDLIGIFNL